MNLFLFQKGVGNYNLWESATSSFLSTELVDVNASQAISGDLATPIKFFERVDNRFIIFNKKDDPSQFVIKKPQDIENLAVMFFTLDEITELFANNPTIDHAMFVSFLPLKATQEIVSKTATFLIKTDDKKVKDCRTGTVYENEITVIPWFVVYKLKDVNLYYVLFNEYSLHINMLNDTATHNQVFVTDYNSGNLRDLVFEPSISNNAKIINEETIYVKGERFTMNPFNNWFNNSKNNYGFDMNRLFVETNFKYTKDTAGVHITITEPDGYVTLCYGKTDNYHLSFRKSKNALYREYKVKQIKG